MKFIFLLIFLFFLYYVEAQNKVIKRIIPWNSKCVTSDNINDVTQYLITFEKAVYYDNSTLLPYYYESIRSDINNPEIDAKIVNEKFIFVDDEDISKVNYLEKLTDKINLMNEVCYTKKVPYIVFKFIPLVRINGKIQKLVSFDIEYSVRSSNKAKSVSHQFASQSVLNSGTWVKIKLSQTGIYKLTYAELVSMGLSNPSNIRIFGNGGGMLPEYNGDNFNDDLVENSVKIVKGNDGVFNDGDYILFYGEAPTKWKYNATGGKFEHTVNLYSDYSYYYITSGTSGSNEVTSQSSSSSPTDVVTTFNDYQCHELQSTNFIKSGQLWVGEMFDNITDYNFNFTFRNLVTSNPVIMTCNLLSRSSNVGPTCSFLLKANSQTLQNVSIPGVNVGDNTQPYAADVLSNINFSSSSDNINIDISYNKANDASQGWLDYIELNAKRNLIMTGDQMSFRNSDTYGSGKITEFDMNTNGIQGITIWDVSNRAGIKEVITNQSGNTLSFTLPTDTILELMAFDGSTFLHPTFVEQVDNQNLHSLSQIDFVIVTNPVFLSYANQLADIHRTRDSLRTAVVTTTQLYNEFSSGTPDPGAIRNFMRMLYSRAGVTQSDMPKYLLLFGDGSYDNKTISSSNTNFIPTYESLNSIQSTNSFVTDDYYALLDDNEGTVNGNLLGNLDIGVGRFPVKTVTEAQTMINKVNAYISTSSMSSWRNTICFVGDDGDGNQHMRNSDVIASYLDTNFSCYNINKIYLDAYQLVSTPRGQKYPDATVDFDNIVNKGALILNYIGHGGVNQLSHKEVITLNDILSWNNMNNMPFFFTATCEFSKFDDFQFVPAGVQVLLNPNGGGIGLFSTTRLVYSSQNQSLNVAFFDNVFLKNSNGKNYRLGDIMLISKNTVGGSINTRNFTLLADPALKLAYPQFNVRTDSINNVSLCSVPDTLKALAMIRISGHVNDNSGSMASSFNGIVYPVIYDKKKSVRTLGHDVPMGLPFTIQNSILYKGKASVINGRFSFSFYVPKDIAYDYGYGKISYYTKNQSVDGNGFLTNVIIGGSTKNPVISSQGPTIRIFLNDTNFVYGGITDENPTLIAYVHDRMGVNTVGNGIGHDITAVLDNSTNHTIVLNDYYEADLDNYQSGKIQYALSDLSEGVHKINLKVWDVNNNSSQEEIEFLVAKYAELSIDHLLNYPNPFTTSTKFYFDHNQPNTSMDIILQIFTVSGKLVKTITAKMTTTGYHSDPILWDGRDDYGDRIGKGVYIYRIKVRSQNGNVVNKFEKLMILQ